MPLSNYYQQKILENVFGVASYTVPTLYLAGFGSGGSEWSYGSYARVDLTGKINTPTELPGTPDTPSSGGGEADLDEILFPAPTGAGFGPPAGSPRVYDASSSGNELWSTTALAGNVITCGAGGTGAAYQPRIPAGWLLWSLMAPYPYTGTPFTGFTGTNPTVLTSILSYATGFGDYSPTTIEFGLLNAWTDFSTYTEITGGSYARVDTVGAWNTTTISGHKWIQNTNVIDITVGGGGGLQGPPWWIAVWMDGVLFDIRFEPVSGGTTIFTGDTVRIPANGYKFGLVPGN